MLAIGDLLLVIAVLAGPAPSDTIPAPWAVTVEAEEEVYRYEPANNGAGPMWCSGSTCLVRVGTDVFASGLETLPGVKPMNNCRWLLFRRGEGGWERVQADPSGRTREPCPLATFAGGPVFLSANPTLVQDPNVAAGPARPEILRFDPARPKDPYQTLLPRWAGQPTFTEHSYRSLAADGPRRELILFQNQGYTHAEWAFLDRHGNWSARGKLEFPFGKEYEKPRPIRVCYPTVALKDRAVYFCGVSDIEEPNPAWREFKRKLTGRTWDYDFRRLFFTWSRDITTGKFEPWVEIASREKTAGWIMPADLWVAPDGAVHVLWLERAIDTRLREKFFPHERQSQALNYAVLREGRVVLRRSLIEALEGQPGPVPAAARFHITPEPRLLVFCYVAGSEGPGKPLAENRLFEVLPDGSAGPSIRVAMRHPLVSFFTATPRAGSAHSDVLDLLGTAAGEARVIRYARIRVLPLGPMAKGPMTKTDGPVFVGHRFGPRR